MSCELKDELLLISGWLGLEWLVQPPLLEVWEGGVWDFTATRLLLCLGCDPAPRSEGKIWLDITLNMAGWE